MATVLKFPLTPEQAAAKTAELNANGVQLTLPEGTVSAKGCKIAYAYDGAELTVTILSTPPFCGGLAKSTITKWFKES